MAEIKSMAAIKEKWTRVTPQRFDGCSSENKGHVPCSSVRIWKVVPCQGETTETQSGGITFHDLG